MSLPAHLPAWVLSTSLVAALATFALPEPWHRARAAVNLGAAVAKLMLVAIMGWGVLHGRSYETRIPFVPEADLVLRADSFSLLFVTLSAVLWLATTLYAVGYLEGGPHQRRFFGFFSLCVAATMGIALAGNLLSFFFSYELLTLSTYPLVVHRGTREAVSAGDFYLAYTLGGGAVFLAGVALLHAIAGPIEWAEGGALAHVGRHDRPLLVVAFVLLVAGLGVKAALVPLHGWLPRAMVAPAPVSALLHAVAVVKAGAFGITRVVYNVYGIELFRELGVARPLAWVAIATILFGSIEALRQTDIKRRLAYSTVSQIAYIVLGVAVVGSASTIGGIVHIVHQGLMKITLFFCAGNLDEALGVHDVRELRGVGRRMPWTMSAFTVAALGMIGVPPMAGFVSKWYLGLGAAAAGDLPVIGVLLASSLLNAAYFLPMIRDAWVVDDEPRAGTRSEVGFALLLPTVGTAVLSIVVGVFASFEISPLGWARMIAAREFGE